MGEKLTDLEPFYPDRMASRILGMGDIYAGAKDINEARAQKAAEADFEDAECTEAESADAAETVEE